MKTVRLYTAEEVAALLNKSVVAKATKVAVKTGKSSGVIALLNDAFATKEPVKITYRNSFNKVSIKDTNVYLMTGVLSGKSGAYTKVAFRAPDENGSSGRWKVLSVKGISIG